MLTARAMRPVGHKFENDFGASIDRLRRHARIVDETAIATKLQQTAQYRQEAERVNHQNLNIQCAEWLQPANVDEYHV